MKLGNLNAAIDATPKVWVAFSFGQVAVIKGALKTALAAHHGGQRTAETGLRLEPSGQLVWEVSRDY